MTKQRKSRKVLKEKDFQHGKRLLSVGSFSNREVADILGVSLSTVGRISLAETLTEMRERNRETVQRSYAKKHAANQMPKFEEQLELSSSESQTAENAKPIVNQPTQSELIQAETLRTLQEIAKQIERLADSWEKSPEKKKGIFRG